MELKDTIELMTSNDYTERFKAEYLQLRIRADGLEKMLDKWDKGKIEFEPKCSRELLENQLISMKVYANYLEERAEIEETDLSR